MKEKEEGAAGIQLAEKSVRYFCLEYPVEQELCVMTYNYQNGNNKDAWCFKGKIYRGGVSCNACLCKYSSRKPVLRR